MAQKLEPPAHHLTRPIKQPRRLNSGRGKIVKLTPPTAAAVVTTGPSPEEQERMFNARRAASSFLNTCFRLRQERNGALAERRFIRKEYDRVIGKFMPATAPKSLAMSHIYYTLIDRQCKAENVPTNYKHQRDAEAALRLSWKYSDYTEHFGEVSRLLDSSASEQQPGQPGTEGVGTMAAKKLAKAKKNVGEAFKPRIMMFDAPATSVVRTLASMKYTTQEIKALVAHLKVPIGLRTVDSQVCYGRAGKPGVEISPENLKLVAKFIAPLRAGVEKAAAVKVVEKAKAKKLAVEAKAKAEAAKPAPAGKKKLPPPAPAKAVKKVVKKVSAAKK